MIAFTVADGTEVDTPQPGAVAVHDPARRTLRLRDLAPATVAGLLRLVDGPVPVDDVTGDADLRGAVLKLARVGLVRVSVVHDGTEALRATLTSALARFDFDPVTGPVRLSRLALVRRLDADPVVEAPAAGTRITVLAPRLLGVVGALCLPMSLTELHAAVPDCPPELVDAAVRLMTGAGVAGVVGADGLLAEERHPVLRQRELPDVLAHASSRVGLTDQPIGGTYPFGETAPPAPAVKPCSPTGLLPLYRPDLDTLPDPSLVQVMERRRSARRFGQTALTATELGEFLFRVARVRAIREPGPDDPIPYESSDRPYPSGGAAYDLELYLTVLRCDGIDPGIYHYEPVEHALTLVNADQRQVVGMLVDANRSASVRSAPQVLITMASRFERLSWKYQGIAYTLSLKHVGVLYATMYLAATAMGLGMCALGSGDAARFAEATGLDPLVESSVGELLLGSVDEPVDRPS